MEELWIFPLITAIMALCLLVIFCVNCVRINDEDLWTLITRRRNRNPYIRDTVTAPPVMFSNRPNAARDRPNDVQDLGNVTIA